MFERGRRADAGRRLVLRFSLSLLLSATHPVRPAAARRGGHLAPGPLRRPARPLGAQGAGGDSGQARAYLSLVPLVRGAARNPLPHAAGAPLQPAAPAAPRRRPGSRAQTRARDLRRHLGRRARPLPRRGMAGADGAVAHRRRRRGHRPARGQGGAEDKHRGGRPARGLRRPHLRHRRRALLGLRCDRSGAGLPERSGTAQHRRVRPHFRPAHRPGAQRFSPRRCASRAR